VESEIENIEKINFEANNLKKILNSNEANFSKLNEKIKNAKISNEKMELIGEKIKQRDELKENIQKFKKECLEEKQILENQIESLERKNEKMNEKENFEVFEEIDRNYNETYDKLLYKKKDLFEQNKIINLLTRRIQVFPSKLELIQYQKRFQELYDQINNVVEKLKNLINEVNSKEEVKKLLNQKVN
jgi:predicted  nucleic acid-binding Zn-ribbon protein